MNASALPSSSPAVTALGQWDLRIDTPIGTKATRLGLEQTPAGVSGWMIDLFGQRIPATQAEVNGDQVAWRMDITMPVTLTIHFTATVTGLQMSGEADCAVARMTFVGSRLGAAP